MALTKAIDDLLKYVGDRGKQTLDYGDLPDEFYSLDTAVYVAARQLDLLEADMPRRDATLDTADFMFLGKMNVPCVRNRSQGRLETLTLIATDGWAADMGALRQLTEFSERTKLTHAQAATGAGSLDTTSESTCCRAASEAPEPITPATKAPAARLTVDLACKTLTLDGKTFDVSSEQALRWVNVLIRRPREWITSATLVDHDHSLDGVRTSVLRRYLPPEVRELIESRTGAGTRYRSAV